MKICDRTKMAIDGISTIYNYLENRIYGNGKPVCDYSVSRDLSDVCDVLYRTVMEFSNPRYYSAGYNKKQGLPENKDDVVLLFNGGMTSVATAIFLKRLNNVNPHLLFLRNTYGKMARYAKNNEDAVKKIASKLELPLDIIQIKLDYRNPVYKMSIICNSIIYAIEKGFSHHIYIGGFTGISMSNSGYLARQNTQEYRRAQEISFRRSISDFEIRVPLPSQRFMWDELMRARSIIGHIFTDSPVEKSILYMYMVDHNLQEDDNSLLYMKCFDKLRAFDNKQTGMILNDRSLWKKYFFYNIEKSKYAEKFNV